MRKPKNPDPSKYMIRKRKSGYILVDKAILRWRKSRKQRELQEKVEKKVKALFD